MGTTGCAPPRAPPLASGGGWEDPPHTHSTATHPHTPSSPLPRPGPGLHRAQPHGRPAQRVHVEHQAAVCVRERRVCDATQRSQPDGHVERHPPRPGGGARWGGADSPPREGQHKGRSGVGVGGGESERARIGQLAPCKPVDRGVRSAHLSTRTPLPPRPRRVMRTCTCRCCGSCTLTPLLTRALTCGGGSSTCRWSGTSCLA